MFFERLTSYPRHVHQLSSYIRSIERLARRRVFCSSVVQVRNLISDGLLRFVAVNYLRAVFWRIPTAILTRIGREDSGRWEGHLVVEGGGGSKPSGCCERGCEVRTKTRKRGSQRDRNLLSIYGEVLSVSR